MRLFSDPTVEAYFNSYPNVPRNRLLALRELIFTTAESTKEVGELQETLRWGEPTYLTTQTKSGSIIRIDWKQKCPAQYAMYFHCQTNLVDSFRSMFANDFTFEGNRAIIFKLSDSIPADALAFCIEAALTYRVRKRLGVQANKDVAKNQR